MATLLEIREQALPSGRIASFSFSSPDGSVNVLNRRVAEGMLEYLAALDARPDSRPSLLVLESETPSSFLNGTELMLAQAVSQTSDVGRLFGAIGHVYGALERCAVPTVALVDGSCFGCGVELALRCRHRLAVDRPDTMFYMTELDAYRMPPVFGGMDRLPALVGVEAAARLLLFGERWSVARALGAGLVDASIPANAAARLDALDALIGALAPTRNDRRPEPVDTDAVDQRLAELPAYDRAIFVLCWEAICGRRDAGSVLEEVLHSMDPAVWRCATAAFFTGINSRVVSIGTSRVVPNAESDLLGSAAASAAFLDRVRCTGRWLRISEAGATAELAFRTPAADTLPFRIAWGSTQGDEASWADFGLPLLDFPGDGACGVCELWTRDPVAPVLLGKWQDPMLALLNAGYEVVRSCGVAGPVGRQLLELYQDAVAELIANGAAEPDIDRSLWAFGFTRSSAAIRRPFRKASLVPGATSVSVGRDVPALLDALLGTLREFGKRVLAEGRLRHRSQFNVLLQLLLGYPVSRPALLA